MSNLYQKISSDLKEALKTGQGFRLGVLRFVLSVLHNKEIEKRGKGLNFYLSDDEVIEILAKELKKREEAAEIYKQGGRNDLAEQELKESEIIKQYLPKQLSAEEIENFVMDLIARMGAKDIKDLGRVMKEAMQELRGRASAELISRIVKKHLTS